MHDTITGPVFQEMLIFGAASIAKEKQSINDLNVFPVPDGDTGTNMSLTMQRRSSRSCEKRSPATVDAGLRPSPPAPCCAARAATPASFSRCSSADCPRASRAASPRTAAPLPPPCRRA